MRILVACEESQEVTRRFREKGHEAFSCDLYETSGDNPQWHIQGDVIPLLKEKWDMIIAFPPCTHLAVSGAAHFAKKRADGRQQQGIDFFNEFVKAKCPKKCIENPIGIMSTQWRKPNQIVHPWMFGDEYSKATCLWLEGLPNLVPTDIVGKGEFKEWKDKKSGKTKRQAMWFYQAFLDARSNEERSKIRSKTFGGLAQAMADQWG